MNTSLAVQFRPKTFDEVVGQETIIKILKKQVETQQFKNCYLFSGASGCGKTSVARIFAKTINNGVGEPIEIDAASNNGVDNIRNIIEEANKRSLDSEYKVYIMDEAHSLTSQSWQSLLKTIEEPPKYTIFIFCTTNPEKIPETILNRLQKFNFTKISTQLISNRLKYILSQLNYSNINTVECNESCNYLATISNGSMRNALTNLDKCLDFNENLTIENILKALGNFSYNTFFDLSNAIIDRNASNIITIIESIYNEGYDLKSFIEQYLDFLLSVSKYCLFKDISLTNITSSSIEDLKYLTNIDNASSVFLYLISEVLNIKTSIKYDTNIKNTILIMLLRLCKE